MAKSDNPFTEGDYKALNDLRRQLTDYHVDLQKASACGRDCQDMEMARQALLGKLDAIVATYFPGRT